MRDGHAPAPPVLGGSPAAVAEVAVSLVEGTPHDPVPGRTWVRDEHGVGRAVDTVAATYSAVLAQRQAQR